MKKNIVLFLLSLAFLRAQPTEEEVVGGFLALSFSPGVDLITNQSQGVLALDFVGASEDHEIRTRIGLLYNALLFSETLQNQSIGKLYPFSFFYFEVDYSVKQWKQVALQVGYLLSHQGYLHQDFKLPTYQLQLGVRGSVLWFLHSQFMLRSELSLPLGIYRHNLTNPMVARSILEITWDPLGPINNPQHDSAFYAIGFESEYFSFTAYRQRYQAVRYRPYFKFSLLY